MPATASSANASKRMASSDRVRAGSPALPEVVGEGVRGSSGDGHCVGADALSVPTRPKLRGHAFQMGGTRLVYLLAASLLLVGLDLASKLFVFRWLGDPATHASLPLDSHGHARHPLLGESLALMLNLNYGAAFGRLANIPHVLVVGRALAVLLIVWLIARAPRAQPVYLAALVLILAGALGNLYDNFFFRPEAGAIPRPRADMPFGPVRDFIDVYFPMFDWHFPTFNVADSCITVGAVLLFLSGWLGPRSAASAADSTSA